MVFPGEVDHELDHGQLFTAPRISWDTTTVSICDAIFRRYVQPKDGEVIPDAVFCDLPKWVFLEYAVAVGGSLLQGSNEPELARLQPIRLSQNLLGWNEPRYLAFPSGVIAMFNAVLDGKRLADLDCASRSTVTYPFGSAALPTKFYFGLDYRAVSHAPWRPGTVYFYDAKEFPSDVWEKPFFSKHPIRPTARLRVSPQDWPMLDTVEGIDLVAQTRRQWDTFKGYPWHEDDEIHPNRWKRPLVAASKTYLAAHFTERVTLSELGKRVGLSTFAMLRTFQAEVGISPAEYLAGLRIGKAKELLRAGLPIGQAAAECGFCDQTHLNRHFRRRLGLTAGQYVRAQDRPSLAG
ncbi:transcriptional regulator, AraC family [Fimbriimonas ginsengisoli Gsoil 348]|uniref:Transcriptional regulator, AraC family n=1 Tax=Fimbriimonas ginsengisoli Gsoil 348 TaxID=661478 RepID=A0A068NLM6_FIMGI|nr:transcriptional regulator, AraC family [Fimbriimonas ginsengisoli Gsoil 348]